MILHISFKVFLYNEGSKMKAATRYVVPLMVLLFSALNGYAAEHGMPYGDYPLWNSAYGICSENMNPRDAEVAIEKYFAIKGLRAANMRHKGRFIEADVYRDSQLYDKIIFDRKTGRIRSIY